MVFRFIYFCYFNGLLHLIVLASVVVNQKASTEADVRTNIDGVLKHAPDKIGARGGKIYHKDKRDRIF